MYVCMHVYIRYIQYLLLYIEINISSFFLPLSHIYLNFDFLSFNPLNLFAMVTVNVANWQNLFSINLITSLEGHIQVVCV